MLFKQGNRNEALVKDDEALQYAPKIGFDRSTQIPGMPFPHCGRARCIAESGDDPAPQCLAPPRCLAASVADSMS